MFPRSTEQSLLAIKRKIFRVMNTENKFQGHQKDDRFGRKIVSGLEIIHPLPQRSNWGKELEPDKTNLCHILAVTLSMPKVSWYRLTLLTAYFAWTTSTEELLEFQAMQYQAMIVLNASKSWLIWYSGRGITINLPPASCYSAKATKWNGNVEVAFTPNHHTDTDRTCIWTRYWIFSLSMARRQTKRFPASSRQASWLELRWAKARSATPPVNPFSKVRSAVLTLNTRTIAEPLLAAVRQTEGEVTVYICGFSA